MEKQLKLFEVPDRRAKSSLWYIEIEEDESKYVLWLRLRNKISSPAQAKKIAAIKYNRQRGFCDEAFVKFRKVEKK